MSLTLNKGNILFGLNITYMHWRDGRSNQRQLLNRYREYFDRMEETGVSGMRVPLLWNLLQSANESLTIINDNSEELDRIQGILELAPKSISILGVLLNPPTQIAAAYFEDPSIMPDLIDAYSRFCVNDFSNIKEWEIWNEPNASDFYLSIRDKGEKANHRNSIHRPWTPDEFIDHILLPGSRAIRSIQPEARICIGGFAENGLVGHDDREPALSNRLPRNDFFNRLRSEQGAHGHFYFIPNFAAEFIHSLTKRKENGLEFLFDAWGLHPYPYFQIHKAPDENLVDRSVELVNAVLKLSKQSALSNIECWITEVGARSCDMTRSNEHSELLQEEYYSQLPERIGYDKTINRVYWYKLIDTLSDIQNEKPFGLLDNKITPKRSFWALKNLNSSYSSTHQYLRDDFWYGNKFPVHAFDPQFWDIESDTNYRLCYPLLDREGKPSVMVSPGRWLNNWVTLTTKSEVCVGDDNTLKLSARFSLSRPPAAARWSLLLSSSEDDHLQCVCSLTIDKNGKLTVKLPCFQAVFNIDDSFLPFAISQNISGIDLEFDRRDTAITLNFGELKIFRVIQTPGGIPPGDYGIQQKFEKLGQGKPFLVVKDFRARTKVAKKWAEKYPAEIEFPAHAWTVITDTRSQIDQENWVLGMIRYRHDGYFVEIGGDDGIGNSNSYLLEKEFGWQGIMVEANPRLYKMICQNRNCTTVNYAAYKTGGKILEFVDAGAVGGLVNELQDDIHMGVRDKKIQSGNIIKVPTLRGDDIFQHNNAPKLIDYLSVDTEGSELSVLQSIDFSTWKICMITVEHAGNQDKRQQVMSYLEPYGYERIRIWFEDWFFHPHHLAEALGLNIDEARKHIDHVNATIPYIRRCAILEQAETAYKKKDIERANVYFEEVLKTYYPDNAHAYVRAAEIFAAQGQAHKAVGSLERVLSQRPNHPGALRQLVLAATQAELLGKARNAYDKLKEQHPHILKEPEIAKAAMAFL